VARLAGLRAPRLRGSAAWLPTLVALAAGLIFVIFGAGHFADHGAEVADFRGYEVPFPSLAVWAVGVVELGGGVALLLGLFVRPAAAALAVDLVGVIVTAGRVEGGFFSLGLAPLLLAAMVFLVWAGPGAVSLDAGLRRRSPTVHRVGVAAFDNTATVATLETDGMGPSETAVPPTFGTEWRRGRP
jgi:putative oxidoreductase